MRIHGKMCAIVVAAFVAASAQAAFVYDGWAAPGGTFSTVGQVSADEGDETHVQILEYAFGQTFTGANGKNYGDTLYTGSGGLELYRIDDTGVDSPMDLLLGGSGYANDQYWVADGLLLDFDVLAAFGTRSDHFGYYDGSTGTLPTATTLFDIAGFGYAATGSAADVDMTSAGVFAFAQIDDSFTNHGSADNYDHSDHMIAYEVVDPASPNGPKTWILMFEDKNTNESEYDGDYNDLIVKVTVVPEPASIALALLGLPLALRRRR